MVQNRLTLLLFLALCGLPSAAPRAAAAPAYGVRAALSVAIPPGAAKDAALRLLLQPYAAAAGLALADTKWDGASLAVFNLHRADLTLLDAVQQQQGCASGALLHVAPPAADLAAATPCGVNAYTAITLLAWHKTSLPAAPNWGDFWDIARHPGRRALPQTARVTLEAALLADGVAPAELYRTLAGKPGQDRAFRKLDQLKPYLLWWTRPEQAVQWLATGKVLMAATPLASLHASHAAAGIATQPAGGLAETYAWAIPHDAAQPEAARQAITAASDFVRQAGFAAATGLVPASAAARLLTASGQPGALAVDGAFWAAQDAALSGRFTVWLGH